MKDKFLLRSIILIILLTTAGTIHAQITGSGTANYIPRFSGTSTIGNSIIYQKTVSGFVSSDNYVGIGTIDPNTKLHVSTYSSNNWVTKMINTHLNGKGLLVVGGSLSNNNTVFELQNSETTNNSLFKVKADGSAFIEGGIYGLRTNRSLAIMSTSWTNSGAGIELFPDSATYNEGSVALVAGKGATDPKGICFYSDDGTGQHQLNMRIKNNGNVGIGASSPAYRLDISDNINDNWVARIINSHANGKGLLVVGGSKANGGNTVFELQNAETNNNSLFSVLSGGTVNIGSGMSKITLGDAGCVAPLWDCRYIGFNAERTTDGWTINSNAGRGDNGGGIIYTTVGGDINFVSIPTHYPLNNQTFSDDLISQKKAFTIYNDTTGNSKTRTYSYNKSAQMWVMNNQYGYGMGVDAAGKGYLYGNYYTPIPLMTFYNNNIGIGTTTPEDQLHIKRDIQNLSGTVGIRISSSQFPWFIGLNHSLSDLNLIFANGNDKNNPNMVLTSDGGTKFSNGISKLGIGSANNPTLYGTSYVGFNAYRDGSISSWIIDGNNSAHNGGSLIYGTKNGNINFVTLPSTSGTNDTLTDQNILDHLAMTIAPNGNIGMGTTNLGDYKLSVTGKIHCTEVVVEATPWPDYVFDKGYKLMPVKELEQYVSANKHLPGIPDAKTVSEKGVSVGEMNAQLLKKVEELTQYIILLNQRIEKLESQNTNH